jgi:broad specificity phosphatase PhoE
MQNQTVLTLVRHGETPANIEGVWHGSIDSPLTERGEDQAQRAAGHLQERHSDAVALFASPLQRAARTASIIGDALALQVQLEPGLAEYDLGSWEGLTYRELYSDKQLWKHMKTDPDFAPHGGESPIQATLRFTAALVHIAGRHPGERVVVVAHGGVLSMALAHLVDGHYTRWRAVMDNCAVSELVLDPSPELLSFNHTSHLSGV